MEPNATYSADELATLSGTPRRTIRYYIQLGIIDRPIGETRAAHYTWKHLGQLLEIRRLTEEGFSLERIGELMKRGDAPAPPPAPRPGELRVQTHIHLAPGVELVIEPGVANLSPEQLRQLARESLAAYARTLQSKD